MELLNQQITIQNLNENPDIIKYFEQEVLFMDKSQLERIIIDSGVKFVLDFKHKYMTFKELGTPFVITTVQFIHLKELITLANSRDAQDRANKRELDRAMIKKNRKKSGQNDNPVVK